jgi:ABC-type sugar transport system substrate-binding protein
VQGGGGAGGIEGLRTLGILLPSDDPNHVWVALNDTGTSELKEVDAGRVDAFSTHCHQDMWDMVTQLVFWNVVLGQAVPPEVVLPMSLVTEETSWTPLVWGNPVYPRLPTGQWDLWPVCNFTLAPKDMNVDYPTLDDRETLMGY